MTIRRKARSQWLALIPEAHEGYVSWERFEAIRTMVSSNIPTSRHHGAPKHGAALLAGLIRCRRCGRKLTLRYSGPANQAPEIPKSALGSGTRARHRDKRQFDREAAKKRRKQARKSARRNRGNR